jgi:hypothetical protein
MIWFSEKGRGPFDLVSGLIFGDSRWAIAVRSKLSQDSLPGSFSAVPFDKLPRHAGAGRAGYAESVT